MKNLHELIFGTIAESGASSVAVRLRDIETGEEWGSLSMEPFHAASTMKVCVMVELFRQAELGMLSLEDKVQVINEFASLVDGSPYSVDAEEDSAPELHELVGQKATLIELAIPMITRSSNLATNILVERLGAQAITKTMKKLGCDGLTILRGVEDGKAYRMGLNNSVCAQGLTVLMAHIALGSAVSELASKRMCDILLAQEHRRCIPAGLPAGVLCANKTGWNTRICHDTAIVFPPGRKPYILTVLTRGLDEATEGPALIASISKRVYESVAG